MIIIPPERFPCKFCIETPPPRTAECERSFSQVNVIASDGHSRISLFNDTQLSTPTKMATSALQSLENGKPVATDSKSR